MSRGRDDHPEEIFGGAVKKRTYISTPEGSLIWRGHKIFSETSEKLLDKFINLCYILSEEKTRAVLKTRKENKMKKTLTLMEIYQAARATFIQDYNYQQEQCEKMKRLMKSDPEHKERYEKLLQAFEKCRGESSDKFLYIMELIETEQEKTGATDARPHLKGIDK